MTLLRKIGVLAVAALFAALPVMACAMPMAEMTADERECCVTMAGQCGEMEMAKSHSCCQITVTPADLHALKAASSQFQYVNLVISHALPIAAQANACLALAQWSYGVACTHSPPGLELSTTILRI